MNPAPRKILVVEDDSAIREALVAALELDGHVTRTAIDGLTAVDLALGERFDLILLDLMLPLLNGYDVCRRIRENDRVVPIIMVTAKGDEIDKVLGLELGADDYVVKPFGLRELLARVHVALRRQDSRPSTESGASTESTKVAHAESCFDFAGARIDRRKFIATRNEEVISLSTRELHLIECFFAHRGEVLSREALLNTVWGIDYLGTTRTLDQHVAQVRKKVEAPHEALTIKTVHGVGYQYIG